MVFMPFGKFKDMALADIPPGYLRWLLTIDVDSWLRKAVERELRRRMEAEAERVEREEGHRARQRAEHEREEPAVHPPADWGDILQRWYRGLCMDYHPDRGGTVVAQQVINEAYRRLKELTQAS